MSKVELIQGDCLEYMRTMAAGSVGCVVTDPPYGIGENRKAVMSRGTSSEIYKRGGVIDYGEFTWDSQPATAEQISELRRVSKQQVIFGGNYFVLPPSSSWIVWDKQNSGDFADCELAWTSHKKAIRKFTWLWNGMIKEHPEQRYHPTQKPLALMKWVLENYTQPGDTIFDPFMGSGTTGVACVQTGRNFIGCEIDPGYFAIAKRRIEIAQMQPNLFEAA
jgi:DNA modification methylase